MKIENVQQLMMMQLMGNMFQKSLGDSPAFGVMLESFMKAFESNESGVENLFKGIMGDEKTYKNGGESILDKVSNKICGEINNEISDIKSKISEDKIPAAIEKAIKNAASKYGVEERFIRAVIKQESSFDPYSKSQAGAMGLMQLMPGTASSLGVSNPYNIDQNVDGGTKYLKGLLEAFGNRKEMALAAYNAGPNAVKRRNMKSPEEIYKMPRETRGYVDKVMKYYNNGI